MLKKLFILLIALAPLAAIAQDGKVAYLNSQEIFNAMPELADIEKQLTTKQEEISKTGQAIIDEFNKKNEEFEKVAATASETVKQDQQKQLAQLQERYQSFLQYSQKEMEELRMKLLQPVYQKIQTAIKTVGDEQKFSYILDLASQSIVYYSPTAVDATPLVKTKLNLK
ncbi:MAG: OmpH family outer membrane protein [Dysgonamonadaceae bacterium]|jgi:outer membrane protein|nr:OmpH family outer membrane protein [Dysgonamonadaceae bacterium]